MRYLVPQFISREIKIFGPMSFRQVLFMGAGVGICFFFYFTLANKSFLLFIFLCAVVLIASFGLAFGKYQGVSMANIAVNFLSYLVQGHTFFWKKKAVVSQPYAPPKMKEEEEKEAPMPTTKRSQLEDLSARLET